MTMAIIAGVFVVAAIAGGAYALGWFGGGDSKTKVVEPSKDGSATAPSTTAITMDSIPPGASIIALPGTTIVGHTPSTVTIPSSETVRQFKLVLEGYEEITLDIVPNQAKMELKPELVKMGGSAATPETKTPETKTPETKTTPVRGGGSTTNTTNTTNTNTKPDTSGAVTKPDTSTAVTKPDTGAVETPPKEEPKPEPPKEEPKPEPKPDPAPEAPAP